MVLSCSLWGEGSSQTPRGTGTPVHLLGNRNMKKRTTAFGETQSTAEKVHKTAEKTVLYIYIVELKLTALLQRDMLLDI